jgi:hypothetical protein
LYVHASPESASGPQAHATDGGVDPA